MSDEPVFARRLKLLADHIEAGYHVSREVTVNLLRRAASAERANVLESQRDLLRRTLELCMAERDTAQASEARLREALERVKVRVESEPGGPVTTEVYELAREALASTPNPEEQCPTCGSEFRTSTYGACHRREVVGDSPDPWHRADPTPEPE